MSRLPPFNGRSVFFLFILLMLATALIGIPLYNRAGQVAQTQTVSLLRPGGDVIEFQLDPTDTTKSQISHGEVVYPASRDVDLRDLPQVGPTEKTLHVEFEVAGQERLSDPNFVDPVAQTARGSLAIPSPNQSFAGLDLQNWGAGWPPDTNGDVGPNHYIQTVNTSIGIYDKSTGTRLAAFTFDTFFAGTGTPCDANNNGDPVALYDNVSGRWIITDFAWTNIQNGPYYECIAVSKTADPVSGGWWFYGIRADDATHPWLNDYPKLGVWHDGIYMTANMFDCLTSTCSSASYKGVRLWALNRDELINGMPLNYQYGDLGSAYFSLLPSNAEITQAPPGTPNYLMSVPTTTVMYTWKLSIDWNNVSNSTLTGPFSTSIASFSNAASVPQGGSSVNLDSLAGRLMMQLQYSNVGGTPALWVTHSVSTSGRAGIRWYEFRNLSGTPSVYQQGTYSPDATHRWMGSVAVDSQGNMAVGYSASSSTIHPQIRYAGRLASDPLGQLNQGEATLIAGTGSQTTYSRWGDYSAMTVDVDGCTFWYTTEYYITTGTNWQTRIGSFKFPSCGGGDNPPIVNITNPANEATVSGTVVVTADATDDIGVTQVEFFVDGNSIGVDTNGGDGWSASWDTTMTGNGNHTVSATARDTISQTGSDSISVTVDNGVGGSSIIYLSSTSGGTVDGVRFADEDILAYDTATNTWSMYFDGSDVGLSSSGSADVDAFRLMPDGSILLSLMGDTTIPDIGAVDDSDIVRFVPTSLGSNTAGTYEWYFDGSDVGLTTSGEDVDGIGITPDGRILFTTAGSFSVTGASGADEDILAFTPTQLGATTSGTWELYFDGSDVGLGDSSSEDVKGSSAEASGDLYLTTLGAYSVPGLSGDGDDIFICTPSSLGSTTACTFRIYWDGDAHGYGSESIDGMQIEFAP